MNKPLLRPFKAPAGVYILHPDFVQGIIRQVALQNFDDVTRRVDWDAARAEIMQITHMLAEIASEDVRAEGGSEIEAEIHANEVYESLVAGATGIQ
ncbi:hypothetical protein [Phyllobacterium leguminum]|uniref:Uncharacterized protein n=1 Tax=Phyllobacterium leguminum TaxID=314237 RepID=A0A318T2B9_9HYPH|nr:hypothetical protein [Phyllobacterium leguminum]PYE88769.1 hypothetical protein C7477_106142 [Phyllobacterium leguminum]